MTDEKKKIWLTGASSGIGRALALSLVSAGHRVVISARSVEKLQSVVDEADKKLSSNQIICEPMDATQIDSVQLAAENINKQLGGIDCVIINAGVCEYFDVDKPDWDMMRRVMDVNYFGAINTVRAAIPLLKLNANSKKNQRNQINQINNEQLSNPKIMAIASLASVVPFPRAEAYGASKAAMQYFFEALRIDLQKENIDVTVVQPGFVKTPLTDKNDFPMPFIMNVDDAVERVSLALEKDKHLFYFPKRLGWLLYGLQKFPKLWYWLAVNKLSRQ